MTDFVARDALHNEDGRKGAVTYSTHAISVAIPLYNKCDTVARALHSVFAQTVQDFEIVVVNDGSADGGEKIVAEFTDHRIRLIHQINQGASAARNLAIREIRSDYVAFLDADDTWLPDHLETLLELWKDCPEAALCATRYLFGAEGVGTRPPTIRGLPDAWTGILSDYFSIAAKSDPPLYTSALAVQRKSIDAIGGFPVGVTLGEDLLTWARLAVQGRIAYSMKTTAIIWQRPAQLYRAKPARMPDRDDVVGRGLLALLRECRPEQNAGLKRYIALWHKMRASTCLRLEQSAPALKETWRAIRYDPLAWRLYAYLLLAFLPPSACRWFLRQSATRNAAGNGSHMRRPNDDR